MITTAKRLVNERPQDLRCPKGHVLARGFIGNRIAIRCIKCKEVNRFEIEVLEIAAAMATPSDFETLTVAELKTIAKERGQKGYSTLRKAELVQLLDN